jgi:hypothetical protein
MAFRNPLSTEQQAFINKASGGTAPLQATLWNHFTRYTFVTAPHPSA